jgi:acyl transferase domain-containing protein
LLVGGRYCVSKIPPDLLDRDLYFSSARGVPGKTYCDQAGLVERLGYDPRHHPFPARLEEFVDTVPLMMCRAAADAFREARMDPFQLNRPNTAVYVGCNTSGLRIGRQQYELIAGLAGQSLAELPAFQELAGPHSDAIARETVHGVRSEIAAEDLHPSRMTTSHVIANAVSEAYGLNGPSIVFDAVCSSSLRALAAAQRDLSHGTADMALVGGAFTFSLDPLLQFGMSQAATDNRSCPFSDSADGIVISEAYLMVLVKPLDRAIADGDPIQCIVQSIGISADGKGKGTWAPRKEGQIEALRRAYSEEADMRRLVYLEAHATSTRVGDVTEMEALTEVFAGILPTKIPIGSVKANIGHSLEAAGLTGLVKAMLVLRHNLVPQQIHCETLNSQVDWDALPFFVPRREAPLARSCDGRPRRAAISAFGIGGLNAHAVIEEASGTLQTRGRVTTVRAPASVAKSPAEQRSGGTGDRLRRRRPEPIAVIGCGALFPGARTLEAFRRLVYSSAEAIGPVPEGRWYYDDRYPILPERSGEGNRKSGRVGGFLRDFAYDWRRRRVSPKQIAKANPLLFMLLDSVDAALADAGYQEKEFDRTHTEVIVGTNFESDFFPELLMGGRIPHFVREMKKACRRHGFDDEEQLEAVASAFSEQLLIRMPAFFDELGSFTPSGLASRLAKVLDVMGGAGTVDSGDTSALAAIAQAVASLRAGASSMVICAAGARSVGLQLHALRSRPETEPSDIGAPPAEGAGTLLLKRISDARRDGDPIYAVIHSVGAGFSSNAEEAFLLAIRRAWDTVAWGVRRATSECVESIELSSASDAVRRLELKALSTYYRSQGCAKPLLVGSIDGQIGDTMAASGIASVIKSSIQLERLSVPPLADGCRPVDDSVTGAPDLLLCPRVETPISVSDPGRPVLAAVSSYDSFGSAYHLILERGTRVPMNTASPEVPCPLISKCRVQDDGQSVAEVVFDPRKDRFLLDHRLRSRPLLPGVIAAEAFAQAAIRASSQRQVVAIHDLRYLEGLRFLDDEIKTAKVYVRLDGDRAQCRLTLDFRNRRGDMVKSDRVYTTGTVELGDHNPRLDVACPSGCPTDAWYELVYLDPGAMSYMMYHGPVFRQLQRLVFCNPEFWGECRISSPTEVAGDRGQHGWRTWPATIDACLYLGGLAFWKRSGGIMGLPRSIEHLRFGRAPRPEEECLVQLRVVRSDETATVFDFVLFGENREALILGEGYYLELVPTSKRWRAVFKEPRSGR